MPRVATGLQVPHRRDRDCLLPSLPFAPREFRISPMKPDMQCAPFAANSGLLTHEDLVAIEVFTLRPRAPRAPRSLRYSDWRSPRRSRPPKWHVLASPGVGINVETAEPLIRIEIGIQVRQMHVEVSLVKQYRARERKLQGRAGFRFIFIVPVGTSTGSHGRT
jgi:hypothetical protein